MPEGNVEQGAHVSSSRTNIRDIINSTMDLEDVVLENSVDTADEDLIRLGARSSIDANSPIEQVASFSGGNNDTNNNPLNDLSASGANSLMFADHDSVSSLQDDDEEIDGKQSSSSSSSVDSLDENVSQVSDTPSIDSTAATIGSTSEGVASSTIYLNLPISEPIAERSMLNTQPQLCPYRRYSSSNSSRSLPQNVPDSSRTNSDHVSYSRRVCSRISSSFSPFPHLMFHILLTAVPSFDGRLHESLHTHTR